MSSEIAIKVENLSKCYQIYDQPHDRLKQFILPRLQGMVGQPSKQFFREHWALKDVSFEVKKGETVGIVGRNGCGKSTLLQMICGTLNPTLGDIKTNGRIAALLELGSGFNPEFTGRENIYMNGSILGLSHQEIEMRFDRIVDFSEIRPFIEQQVKTYSSGMTMRLAFAVAVSVDPDILVVDEALAVGDEAFQRKCYSRIEEMKKNGTSILFVTQSTQLVLEICDRVMVLNQGILLFDGEPHRGVNYYYQIMSEKDSRLKVNLLESQSELNSTFIQFDGTLSEASENEQSKVSNLGFDESLVSSTAHEVHNKEYGVVIENILLCTDPLSPSNILQHLQRYKIRFDVFFRSPLPNISYQVLFKTVNGAPISGSKFYYDDIFDITFGQNIKQRVEYDFICNFNPGVYFVSIEVCGGFGDENTVYHKFAEVLAFRVLSNDTTSLGYVSIEPIYKIEII